MKKELEIIELLVDDFCGVNAVSFVTEPAIEEDFMYFSKPNNFVFATADMEQRIVTGPALIPDKLIYRYDRETGKEFNVVFKSNTIKEVSEKYMIEHRNSNVTLQHKEDVEDVSMVETWIIIDAEKDKATALGYELPIGTWMTSFKVNNDGIWKQIKNGTVRGFSIEGAFIENAISMTKQEEVMEELSEDDLLLNKVVDILNSFTE